MVTIQAIGVFGAFELSEAIDVNLWGLELKKEEEEEEES